MKRLVIYVALGAIIGYVAAKTWAQATPRYFMTFNVTECEGAKFPASRAAVLDKACRIGALMLTVNGDGTVIGTPLD